jgi:hypothetical protein
MMADTMLRKYKEMNTFTVMSRSGSSPAGGEPSKTGLSTEAKPPLRLLFRWHTQALTKPTTVCYSSHQGANLRQVLLKNYLFLTNISIIA